MLRQASGAPAARRTGQPFSHVWSEGAEADARGIGGPLRPASFLERRTLVRHLRFRSSEGALPLRGLCREKIWRGNWKRRLTTKKAGTMRIAIAPYREENPP